MRLEAKNEKEIVASPESVPIHLKPSLVNMHFHAHLEIKMQPSANGLPTCNTDIRCYI